MAMSDLNDGCAMPEGGIIVEIDSSDQITFP